MRRGNNHNLEDGRRKLEDVFALSDIFATLAVSTDGAHRWPCRRPEGPALRGAEQLYIFELSQPSASANMSAQPTLPLTDEAGRFYSGISALPARRHASRMWHLAASTSPDAVVSLEHLLDNFSRLSGESWAHPAARNGNGCTPLHVACIVGRPAAVRACLRHASGPEVLNISDGHGE
jgi:hypothetical protein